MGGNPPKPELYCPETVLFGLPEQTTQQRDQGRANQGDTAAGHQLIDPQIGGSHSSMAGGGVSEMIQF